MFSLFIKSVLKPSTMSIRLELYIYNSTVLSVTIASIHDYQQSHFALFYPKFDKITFQCALILKPTLQLVKPTLQFVSIAKPHFQLCLKSSSICTCSKLYNIPKMYLCYLQFFFDCSEYKQSFCMKLNPPDAT